MVADSDLETKEGHRLANSGLLDVLNQVAGRFKSRPAIPKIGPQRQGIKP